MRFLINAQKLGQTLAEPDLRIVDCRFALLDPDAGRQQYEDAHIPGAVYADLDKDLAGTVGPNTGRHPLPDPDSLKQTFSRLGIDKSTTVVAYDDSDGALAARAWWLLRWLGHENAVLLDGGMSAWQEEGLPVESGQTVVEPRPFTGAPRPELVLETAEISSNITLVDARSARRFEGKEEPIDPVAGHVPGAVNLPYTENVDESGCWKDPARLAGQLAGVVGDDPELPWSVMCGSGVTACHLVVAGLLAGFSEPRVYVGSWSEWIRDPSRNVAKTSAGVRGIG